MKDIGARLAVALLAFCAGMASTLFLVPFWARPLISAIQDGKPADWIGFAGNFGAGLMTLFAAAAAIYGAMFAARPVYEQLVEQTRQSDIASLGILSKRSMDLSSDRILIYRVLVGATLIDDHIGKFLRNPVTPASDELDASIDGFEKAVDDLRNCAGLVWGTAQVQKTRRDFLDAAYAAGANILSVKRLNPTGHR